MTGLVFAVIKWVGRNGFGSGCGKSLMKFEIEALVHGFLWNQNIIIKE